tara:strand:+ start:195 stop:1094 length:900 start_codon:yes stop_codon:yes gene_type:complete
MEELLDLSSYGEVVRESPTIKANPNNPEVFGGLPKQGDTGDKVQEVQQALADKGITSVGEVDGAFGNKTSVGIQEFQEKAGLPRTGVLNQATYTQLVETPVSFDEEGKTQVTPVEKPEALDFSSFGEVISVPNSSATSSSSSLPEFNLIAPRLFNDLKRDFGFSDTQAAAFVGNLAVETDQFKTLQEYNPTVEGSRGGYGFAQWTGPRRVAYEKFAKDNNLDPTSYEANYSFLKLELTTNMPETIGNIGVNTASRLKDKQDLQSASDFVTEYFLRPGVPHTDKRRAAAQRVLDLVSEGE